MWGTTALLKKQKKWPRPQGSVELWSWEEMEHLLPLTLLSPNSSSPTTIYPAGAGGASY